MENERCCSIEFTKSLTDSLKKLSKDRSMVEDEIYRERIGVCRDCEHILPLDQCGVCGCFIRIKARFGVMECPLGKW